MNGLKKANIEINRKMLADIALNDIEQFSLLVEDAKKALNKQIKTQDVVVEKLENKTEKAVDKKAE